VQRAPSRETEKRSRAEPDFVPGYAPWVVYVDQFDHLVRQEDRGRAIKNTRTIVVFHDGLVVCAVRVYGGARPGGGIISGLRRGTRSAADAVPGRGEEQIRASAQVAGDCARFAETWPKARLIPFAVVDKIVLTRPRQVSELAIYEQPADPASLAKSTYLGDLLACRVREALEPALGERLDIQVPD
jgi:hypothetical protein